MKRSAALVALLAAVLAGLLLGGAGPGQAQIPPIPPILPTPTPTPPAPPPSTTTPLAPAKRVSLAPRGFVGLVAEDTFAATGATRAGQLRSQAAMGVTLLRQTFDWAEIERVKGQYTLEYYDAYVLEAARAGIRIMPILFRPPAFHSTRPAVGAIRGTYPPRSNAAFAAFARLLNRRYGPRGTLWAADPALRRFHIREWQVWNEPNLPVYWPRKPNAKNYVKMLATVSKSLKKQNRAAKIILAGIPDSKIGGAIRFDRYVRAVFKAKGARHFDAFAVHPYAPSAKSLFKSVATTRKFLDKLPGGKKKRLWITEAGWATQGPRSRYTVGRKRQARYAEQTVAGLYSRRKALKISGFVFYNWKDATPYLGGKDFWGLHAGLLQLDGKRKPAFRKFALAVQKLGRKKTTKKK